MMSLIMCKPEFVGSRVMPLPFWDRLVAPQSEFTIFGSAGA
jgi:hypothetical protein